MQCIADSYLQKHQQGCAKQQSPHCLLLSSFSNTLADRNVDTKIQRIAMWTPQLLIYSHRYVYTIVYTFILWITLSPCSLSFSSYPSSYLHPAPRDNSLPFGQEGRQCRGQPWICSACYLMSVGMSLWACLLVPTSQASIHVESAQSIKQLAHHSAPYFLSLFFLILFLSQLPSLYLPHSLCIFTVCASPCLFLLTNK